MRSRCDAAIASASPVRDRLHPRRLAPTWLIALKHCLCPSCRSDFALDDFPSPLLRFSIFYFLFAPGRWSPVFFLLLVSFRAFLWPEICVHQRPSAVKTFWLRFSPLCLCASVVIF